MLLSGYFNISIFKNILNPTTEEINNKPTILSRVWVTIDGVFDWMIGFISPYTFTQLGTTGKYSAIAILHTSQLTVAHALGFFVFTSRILATDLSQSHWNFKLHVKFSWHRLIPFLPFLWLPIPRLDSTGLDYSVLLLYHPLYSACYIVTK
jgi:hypothetical protein